MSFGAEHQQTTPHWKKPAKPLLLPGAASGLGCV